MRVDPSSIPRAVRPPVIAAPASIVMSRDPSATVDRPGSSDPGGRETRNAARGRMLTLTSRPASCPGPTRAGPDQQRGRYGIGVQFLAPEPGEHELDASAAELGEVLPHRRQG